MEDKNKIFHAKFVFEATQILFWRPPDTLDIQVLFEVFHRVQYLKYCNVFGRMPSLLGNVKLDTPVVARQPKVKHLHGYTHHSVLSRCMVA
jgi:hypothetical protein